VPRIAPGGRREIGLINYGIVRAVGLATGGSPPNVLTTLARHRGLFRRWLPFAGGLMPGGRLPRADTELAILRVAHNTRSEYEWHQHETIARQAGLTPAEIERVRGGPGAGGWDDRQQAVLRAVDELHADRRLSDGTWSELRPLYSDQQLIELCLLVGHYQMLAMTLSSLEVELDEQPVGQTRAMRLLQSVTNRRQRAGTASR
jgi:alkylhydroperoxidase family enzyme